MTRRTQRRLREGLFGGLVAVVLVLGLAANSAAQTPTPVRRTTPTLLLRLTPTLLPRTTPTPLLRTTPTPLRRTTATPSPTPVVCFTSTSIAVGRSVNGQITTTAPTVCYQFQGYRGDKITLAKATQLSRYMNAVVANQIQQYLLTVYLKPMLPAGEHSDNPPVSISSPADSCVVFFIVK